MLSRVKNPRVYTKTYKGLDPKVSLRLVVKHLREDIALAFEQDAVTRLGDSEPRTCGGVLSHGFLAVRARIIRNTCSKGRVGPLSHALKY